MINFIITYIWNKYSVLNIFLLPISWIYEIITNIIKLIYKLGLKKSWKAPIPVIIIGNITVGGNGKTPLVIWLTKKLKKEGIKVGIISRGYKGKSKKYPILINKNSNFEEVGDEPILIYNNTNVPIAVSPIKKDAINLLLNKNVLDVIISDDGLQHHALKRDFEIVVIDSTYFFGNELLLPAGPMRERKKNLKNFNAIVINGQNKKIFSKEIHMYIKTSSIAINLKTKKKNQLKR